MAFLFICAFEKRNVGWLLFNEEKRTQAKFSACRLDQWEKCYCRETVRRQTYTRASNKCRLSWKITRRWWTVEFSWIIRLIISQQQSEKYIRVYEHVSCHCRVIYIIEVNMSLSMLLLFFSSRLSKKALFVFVWSSSRIIVRVLFSLSLSLVRTSLIFFTLVECFPSYCESFCRETELIWIDLLRYYNRFDLPWNYVENWLEWLNLSDRVMVSVE